MSEGDASYQSDSRRAQRCAKGETKVELPMLVRLFAGTMLFRTGVTRYGRRGAAALVGLLAGLGCFGDEPEGPRFARIGGVDIAYQTFGPATGAPVLYVPGVGAQMTPTPQDFLRLLVANGRRVIVYDNRDAGESTHFDDAGTPGMEEVVAAMEAGSPPPLPYSLDDMAGDAVGLLDALEIDRAHIVGGSAGGMIAQVVAADQPERVVSLTLISSSTNNPELPQNAAPFDGVTSPNEMRQGLAVGLAGDLRERASRIVAPTVVVHGAEDDLFPPVHGRDLETSISGAQLVLIEGMGHVPEDEHAGQIAGAIEQAIARSHQ